MNKTRMLLFRLGTLAILVAIAAVMMIVGRGHTVYLDNNLSFEVNLGASLNNTKVKENLMEIDGSSYSILDIWNGQSPSSYTGSYEYINQGGLGWGVFMSGFIGYRVEGVGAIKAGYTCHHSKTTLEGYTAMGWVHCLTVRFEINNFSFL